MKELKLEQFAEMSYEEMQEITGGDWWTDFWNSVWNWFSSWAFEDGKINGTVISTGIRG